MMESLLSVLGLHLSTLTKVKKLPDYELSAFSPCSVCDLTKENWICLTCYSTNCSRFVNQHAEQHFLVENHPMAISISDFSVWCYECNSYVHNEVLFATKNALNKSKFGNDENTNVI
uniref:UBP-type domain-containing protein n=1 Tax=Ditylenchus dipsaci TaxID=166011 RepID=A0A915DD43_9BILA